MQRLVTGARLRELRRHRLLGRDRYRRKQVEVRLAGDTVEIWHAGVLLCAQPARHDPGKEHGAFSTPNGRPHRTKAPGTAMLQVEQRYWSQSGTQVANLDIAERPAFVLLGGENELRGSCPLPLPA